MDGLLATFVTRRPSVGILASLGGFATSLGSFLQHASLFVSFVGAILACAAGFYTLLIKRREWNKLNGRE